MSRLMTGAEMVLQVLADQGVDHIFGYPGGAVLPIYDELFKQDRLKHILVRHEQGAVHAAEGYARSTGKVGCVLVTSGPGATNAVTGLTDALMDSIPIVCITGQVPTHLIGNDAFQETPIVEVCRGITKHHYLVTDVNDIARVVKEAFLIATTGRPGSVLIDMPKNVQQEKTIPNYDAPVDLPGFRQENPQARPEQIKQIAAAIKLAKRPVVYAGGGIIGGNASEELRAFAKKTGIPVAMTVMGLGGFPADHPLCMDMLGMHGSVYSNWAVRDCDLLIALGVRFDDRVTGKLEAFAKHAKIIHIDVDPSELNKNKVAHLPLVGDVGGAIQDLLQLLDEEPAGAEPPTVRHAEWLRQIDHWRETEPLRFADRDDAILPQYAIKRLREILNERGKLDDTYVTTGVGQHQMWAAQYFGFDKPNKWLTSGGLGTMGYGMPAAIGAQLGNPGTLVIDIAGEASIQMNIQEMGTASQFRLPIKVFILNNEYMGMVRQWQELTYESRYSESYSDSLPDFVKLAEAYGWTGIRIEGPQELEAGIKQMIETKGPVLVDCHVAKLSNCFPMIPSGAAHTDMLLGDAEVSGTMDDEAKALV